MKRILWGLLALCVSCSHSVKKEFKGHEFSQDLLKLSSQRVALSRIDAVQNMPRETVFAAAPGRSFLVGVSAASSEPFLGWVKASVGFAKGTMQASELNQYGPEHGLPASWRVLKKWNDGSVRIGQVRMVAYLNGPGITPVNLVANKPNRAGFAWHPAVWDAILTNKIPEQLKITVNVGSQALQCVPASGNYRFLVADAGEVTVRFRSHCADPSTHIAHPLSMTSYFTMYAEDPVVRMTHVLGNDTLEQPVQGGMQLSNVAMVKGSLPQIRWVNESSYGNKSPFLGDGQTMAFKAVMSFDPAYDSTAAHIATGEPLGFQLWQDAVASNAFGTAPLPPTRVPANEIQNINLQISNQAPLPPQSSASSYLGMINMQPPATGAQPDFASTMTPDIQKAHQAYSARQMAAVLLAVYRESYRPSFYWETNNGEDDRVKNTRDPNLFFWGSRIHYSWSWNNDQRIIWRNRTADAGFISGSFSNWAAYDNQHATMNNLRYSFEETGDAYLEDVLKYYVTVVHWMYFTDWLPHTEAERAFGRLTKEAIALTQLFPDLPEAQLLASRIPTKLQAQADGITARLQAFGHVGNNLFDGCDPRVNNLIWCPLQQQMGQGNIVNVAWQTGFPQEVYLMVDNPDLRYLAAAEEYFTPNGTPKTYYPITNPADFTTGGIGIEWWTPYVALAMKYPNAPGAQFVLTNVKPVLDARFQGGCGFPSPYFCLNDGWKTW